MKKKSLLLLLVVLLSSCLKVQKKSEVEVQAMEAGVVQSPVQTNKRVINQMLDLIQDDEIKVDELYLGAQAQIYTNQHNLTIHVQKLFVEPGAFIQTFTEDRRFPGINLAGVDGGTVKIKVEGEVSGNLQVFMNGQDGGAGKIGWLGFMGMACYPGDGKNAGRSGSFFLEASQSDNFFISTSMHVASGGKVGATSTNMQDFNTERAKYPQNYKFNEDCNVIPSPGANGTPGQICLKLKSDESPRCERF